MTSRQKVKPDGVVKTSDDSPHQVLHHGVVFVLDTAVVSMQTGGGFAEAIISSSSSVSFCSATKSPISNPPLHTMSEASSTAASILLKTATSYVVVVDISGLSEGREVFET